MESPASDGGVPGRAFHIHTRDGRDYIFRASSKDEREEWMASVRVVRDKVTSGPGSPDSPPALSMGTLPLPQGTVFLSKSSSCSSLSTSVAESPVPSPLASASPYAALVGRDIRKSGSFIRGKTYTAEDFETLALLGKGAFAKVVLVRKRDSRKIYAMKIIQKDRLKKKKQIEHTIAEKVLLSEVNHPFIVELRMSFQSDTKLFMVLEYVSGGEMFYHQQRQGRFPFERTRLYVMEMVLALQALHAVGVIYRDLKLENILLDADGHIKLSDFGLIKLLDASSPTTSTFCGTPEYLAPEIILGQPYAYSVDWWALGVVTYELCMGHAPFEADQHPALYEKILHEPVVVSADVEPPLVDLIARLLEKKPHARLGGKADELMAHPVFSGVSWDDVLAKRIQPAFRPFVASETDSSNFDPEFTRARLPFSALRHSPVQDTESPFDSFDYFPQPASDSLPSSSAVDLKEAERALAAVVRVESPNLSPSS